MKQKRKNRKFHQISSQERGHGSQVGYANENFHQTGEWDENEGIYLNEGRFFEPKSKEIEQGYPDWENNDQEE